MSPATKTKPKEDPFVELRRRLKPVLDEIRSLGHVAEYRHAAANVIHVHCRRCHSGSDITYTPKHIYSNNHSLTAKCDPAIQPSTHTELCVLRRPATGHRQRIYENSKSKVLYAEYIRDDGSSGANHMLTPSLLDMVVRDLHVGNLVKDEGRLPKTIVAALDAVSREPKPKSKTGGKKGAKKTTVSKSRRK